MIKVHIPILVAALAAGLLFPNHAGAYGGARYHYTHVGPNGVYHTSGAAAYGPRGVATTGHTSAYGYRGGYANTGAARYGSAYRYTPGYGGSAARVGGVHYGYVR